MQDHQISEERVRKSSGEEENRSIDEQSFENVKEYGHKGKAKIYARLEELQSEWDIERMLELNASGLALTGILLGTFADKRWFALSGVVASFLLLHAVHGWCPPVPLLRKMGFRTRDEINREKYALKALHGDFKNVKTAEAAWQASQ